MAAAGGGAGGAFHLFTTHLQSSYDKYDLVGADGLIVKEEEVKIKSAAIAKAAQDKKQAVTDLEAQVSSKTDEDDGLTWAGRRVGKVAEWTECGGKKKNEPNLHELPKI